MNSPSNGSACHTSVIFCKFTVGETEKKNRLPHVSYEEYFSNILSAYF